MEDLVRRFRRVADDREGLRYPRALRQVAVEYAERSGRAGRSQGEAAAALGVSRATLCRWLRETTAAPAGAPLHEIRVVEDSPAAGLVLVLPSGVRVEGLTSDELVKVLGALR